MTLASEYEHDDLSQYRIHSRREVIALLRNMSECNQLIRMVINHGVDTVVTSILEVDGDDNTVILDCAPTATMNQRVLDSEQISFEAVFDNIRILFTAPAARGLQYKNLPAFVIPLPTDMVRLQRREFYRVMTPVTAPVYCMIPIRNEHDEPVQIKTTLYNISGGGVSIVDDKKMIDTTQGRRYENCTIDLPSGIITVTLEVRNSLEITLTNGKSIQRLGCEFIAPSNGTLGAVQKYITKLERDQNAKATGLG
jgi:c-di-GMP-binding flagellar brake protein YcgR